MVKEAQARFCDSSLIFSFKTIEQDR